MTITIPEEGTGERSRRRRQERRRRLITMAAFWAALTVLTASIPGLGYAGYRVLLDSRDSRTVEVAGGRVGDIVFDPDSELPRTPAALVVHVGEVRELRSLTLLSVSSTGEGGSIVFLPIATLVDADGREATLAEVYAEGGKADLQRAVGNLLDLRFDDVTELHDDGWLFVTAPAGPFDLFGEEVESDEVGDWLDPRPNESDLARLVRHEAFWSTWLFNVGGNVGSLSPSRPDLRRDELDLPRFILGLSRGPYVQRTLPVTTERLPFDGSERFRVDAVAARVLVARLMPGALRSGGAAGTRVRLLDAVDDENDVTLLASARRLVPAGARLVLVGDADAREPASQVMYYRPADQPAATALRDALGVGSLTLLPSDVVAFDVTVVVGSDATPDGNVELGSSSTG